MPQVPVGNIRCGGCGRRLDIRWPARSLICSCGNQLLPPRPGAAEVLPHTDTLLRRS